MGTNVNIDKILDIRTAFPDKVLYLCLDRDATTKAASIMDRFRLVADIRVIPLTRDAKHLSDTEIGDLFV